MNDKYNLYAKRSELELRKMRSKKYNRMVKVESLPGWFNQHEGNALREQIRAIDVELEKRRLQLPLF